MWRLLVRFYNWFFDNSKCFWYHHGCVTGWHCSKTSGTVGPVATRTCTNCGAVWEHYLKDWGVCDGPTWGWQIYKRSKFEE